LSSNSSEKENSPKRFFVLSLLGTAFVGVCILFFVAFIWFQPDQLSLSDKYFPSPTITLTPSQTPTLTATNVPTQTPSPTPTLTPHVLITPPKDIIVLEEKFDSNSRGWDKFYSNTNVHIKDSKLFVNSNKAEYVGMAICYYSCGNFKNSLFYIQAEMVPERQTTIEHGISFCVGPGDNYYVFEVNSRAATYSLIEQKYGNWDILIDSTLSKAINRYPISNTLGVYYDQGKMDLYINGTLVNSYHDQNPLTCSWVGFFIDAGTLNLIVDNVYIYNVALTPTSSITPTP